MLPSMYATEWFMTMFCRGFSFDLVTRVWDIFLFEGYKIVYRVGLALLKVISLRTRFLDRYHLIIITHLLCQDIGGSNDEVAV